MKWLFAIAALAGLVAPPGPASADQDKQRRCLATALYYEARDQPILGQLAAGVVVLNRVRDRRWPNTVCRVVEQGKTDRAGNPVLHACAFSYFCDGKPERPMEKEPWATAQGLASLLLGTEIAIDLADVMDATHYHAVWVQPSWTTAMVKRAQIGGHVFYVQK